DAAARGQPRGPDRHGEPGPSPCTDQGKRCAGVARRPVPWLPGCSSALLSDAPEPRAAAVSLRWSPGRDGECLGVAGGGGRSFHSEVRSPGHAEHSGEGCFLIAILLSVVAIQQATVVLVQQVGQFHIEGHFATGPPTGAQVQDTIAGQFRCVGAIAVAAADSGEGGADTDIAEPAVQVHVQGALGAVGQNVARFTVAWIDDADTQVTMPAKQFLLQGCLETVDPGAIDV